MKWTTSAGVACFLVAPLLCAPASAATESAITLSDPCAVFNVETDDPYVTRIAYGEDIDFTLTGQSQAIIDVDELGTVHLKFQVTTHGDGTGLTSGIKYQFKSKVMIKSNVDGYDPLDLDPLDDGFSYRGTFVANARIIGQGSAGDGDLIAQGAQDNAELKFKLDLRYANGEVRSSTSDFTLTCVASPWTNLMGAKQAGTRDPVGRGFGDPWNKYAWSMKDFGGGMVVGTKNAFYELTEVLAPSDAVQQCLDSNFYQVTSIHSQIACMELFAAPNSGTFPAAADTRFAEIWRFDYVKKTWARVVQKAEGSQGFRYMEVHNGKLYVGSDLGAFITGVDLYTGGPYNWNFPGSRLLVSTDGRTFEEVASCVTNGPCSSKEDVNNPYGIFGTTTPPYMDAVNISIRAMASFEGKLYIGTFNALGAQLWSYEEAGTPEWTKVHTFYPVPLGCNPQIDPFSCKSKPAVAELRVAGGDLYIGLAGPAGDSYLYRYDGTQVERVPDQPEMLQTNMGSLKLFTSSNGLLYVGNLDLDVGFYLQVYDPEEGTFREISDNGFFNHYNAYAWSMAEINGRMFVGTFNQDFLTNLPRGEAELWYSDDSINWQQMALPLDWGPWNYGIRTMEVGNKMLFLGAASNMAAPDLITTPVPLSPGTEVWTIRSTVVAPTGKAVKVK